MNESRKQLEKSDIQITLKKLGCLGWGATSLADILDVMSYNYLGIETRRNK